jgi:hypothetical protein
MLLEKSALDLKNIQNMSSLLSDVHTFWRELLMDVLVWDGQSGGSGAPDGHDPKLER